MKLATAEQSERETYRVVVLGRDGTEILLAADGERFALPSVEIPRWQRVAENLTQTVKAEWGEEVVCVLEPDVSVASGIHYQTSEHWRTSGTPKVPTRWVPVSALSHNSLTRASDYAAIQQSIAPCSAELQESAAGPFARMGWFKDLREWVEAVIEPLGFHLNRNFRQVNASPFFSLIRFETDGPALWFKAVGEPNQKEFAITCALAQLFPRYMPSVLATRPEWNGWLAREAAGKLLSDIQEDASWEMSAALLAQLQIDSIDHGARILAADACDLGVNALSKAVKPFIETMTQLMERQTKVPPAILSRPELFFLGDRIAAAIEALDVLGIPETLGHLDLNPGNIVVSANRCAFLDWAEAYIGNPFFSFEYLRENLRRTFGYNSPLEAKLTASYYAPWERVVARTTITGASALVPLLAVFAYATGSDAWKETERLQEPATAGYLRSLARRMHRGATELADRRLPCLQ